MADEPKQPTQQQHQISIQVDAQAATGVYSNLMMISHRKEEFILDFLFVQPQRTAEGQSIATLRSRVITSPEHVKRILKAIEENIGRYEQAFGPIQAATDMPKVVH
jgi:DNA-directed RNA polymerase subunit F